tara:strand:+ start:451 stop:594 length:144 start_codon:yes stop_codon:yes gene_type:complete
MKIIIIFLAVMAVTITVLLTYIEHKIKQKNNKKLRNNIKKLDDANRL